MILKYLMLLILVAVAQGIILFGHWVPWKPGWLGSRDDLLCNSKCEEERDKDALDPNNTYDKCCTCRSLAVWEKDNLLVGLELEYISADGGNLAVVEGENALLNDSYKQIYHENGVMTSLPSNICNMSNLMLIHFSNNLIRSLAGIECAVSLDTVTLDSNRIQHISNKSFVRLPLLRKLTLANNLITRLDSMTLFQPNLRLFTADFSNNAMTEIDISNAITAHMYCNIDYANNDVTKFTNEGGNVLDLNVTYGPGFTSFENNKFETFPNFQQLLQLDDLNQIGKLFGFGFSFMGVPIICDCNMENYLNLGHSGGLIEATWKPYYNVTCAGPEKYIGTRVVEVPLQDLVCSLGVEDNCPIECSCVDQPYHNTIKIECINALMTSLPPTLPTSYFSDTLSLNVSGNDITEIPDDLPYLDRIEALDISDNNLKHISEKVASKLENVSSLIISNNPNLRSLPQGFQYRNACSLELGKQVIDCNCDSLWIEQWMDVKGCPSKRDDIVNLTYTTTVKPSESTKLNTSEAPAPNLTATEVLEMTTSDKEIADSATTIINDDLNTTLSSNDTSRNYSNSAEYTDGKETHLYCNVPGLGVMKASEFKSDMLTCGTDPNAWIITVTYSLVSVVTVLIMLATIVYLFRYEFLVLFVRAMHRNFENNEQTSVITYDAFVSFDEENAALMKWMEKFLIPHLEGVGYKLFIPYRHIEYGDVRDDSTIKAMKKSRNMVIVMSESYLEPKEERSYTENEWKYGWNNFKSGQNIPIVVVNYDHITADMVDDPRIKAYLRVGKVIDFTNRSRDIMPKVEFALGKPQSNCKDTRNSAYYENPAAIDAAFYNAMPDIGDKTPLQHFHRDALLEINDQTQGLPVDNHAPMEQFETVSDDDSIESDVADTYSNNSVNVTVIEVKPTILQEEPGVQEEVLPRHSRQTENREFHQDVDMFNDKILKHSSKPYGHGKNKTKSRRTSSGWEPYAEHDLPKRSVFLSGIQNDNSEDIALYSAVFKRLYRPGGSKRGEIV